MPSPAFIHACPPLPTLRRFPPFPSGKSSLFWKYVLPPEQFKRPSKREDSWAAHISQKGTGPFVPPDLPFGSLGAQPPGRRSAALLEGDGAGLQREATPRSGQVTVVRPPVTSQHRARRGCRSSEALALQAPRVKGFQWERAGSPPPGHNPLPPVLSFDLAKAGEKLSTSTDRPPGEGPHHF